MPLDGGSGRRSLLSIPRALIPKRTPSPIRFGRKFKSSGSDKNNSSSDKNDSVAADNGALAVGGAGAVGAETNAPSMGGGGNNNGRGAGSGGGVAGGKNKASYGNHHSESKTNSDDGRQCPGFV